MKGIDRSDPLAGFRLLDRGGPAPAAFVRFRGGSLYLPAAVVQALGQPTAVQVYTHREEGQFGIVAADVDAPGARKLTGGAISARQLIDVMALDRDTTYRFTWRTEGAVVLVVVAEGDIAR